MGEGVVVRGSVKARLLALESQREPLVLFRRSLSSLCLVGLSRFLHT